MRPPAPAAMTLSAAAQPWKVPLRLTEIRRSQVSGSASRVRPGANTPAAFTHTPSAVSAAARSASANTAARSLTSRATGTRSARGDTVARSAANTVLPSARKLSATAPPMSPAAPVTTTPAGVPSAMIVALTANRGRGYSGSALSGTTVALLSLTAADQTVRACARAPDFPRAAFAAESNSSQIGIALACAFNPVDDGAIPRAARRCRATARGRPRAPCPRCRHSGRSPSGPRAPSRVCTMLSERSKPAPWHWATMRPASSRPRGVHRTVVATRRSINASRARSPQLNGRPLAERQTWPMSGASMP